MHSFTELHLFSCVSYMWVYVNLRVKKCQLCIMFNASTGCTPGCIHCRWILSASEILSTGELKLDEQGTRFWVLR